MACSFIFRARAGTLNCMQSHFLFCEGRLNYMHFHFPLLLLFYISIYLFSYLFIYFVVVLLFFVREE